MRRSTWAVVAPLVVELLAGCGTGSPTLQASGAPPTVKLSPTPPPAGTTLITFVTSPVPPGGQVTVRALAPAGATCRLTVSDPAGHPSGAALAPMKTDKVGDASWTWRVSAGAPRGRYHLKLVCSPGATSTTSFVVG